MNEKKNEAKSLAREIMEWIGCIVIAFLLALLIKYFLFTPTLVMQDSMTPNILNGERVLINRTVRTFNGEYKRGDIITFEAPASLLSGDEIIANFKEVDGLIDSFKYYVIEWEKTSYIKRVIGLPGEHVQIQGGYVYINGERLQEDYLDESVRTYVSEGGIDDFIVPDGCIFAMGDNRNWSTDCRLLGCIPMDKIEGRVTIRIWPPDKFGKIDK